MVRGGSRAAATSKMEWFVIIINGFQSLTIITALRLGCCSSPWSASDGNTESFFTELHFNQNYSDSLPWFNPLSANITKWSNTLKQFVGILPTNCLSVFDHFVGLPLKRISELNNSYFPWNRQKTIGYLMILGRIEVD